MVKRFNKAFTLIELMVVVAIIAIITAMIIGNIMTSRQKARDAKRIADLGQIQLALEQYFSRCGVYPSALSTLTTSGTCPSGASRSSFISVIPTSPSPGSYSYSVRTDSGYVNFDYVLGVTLEISGNDVMKSSLPSFPPVAGATYSPSITCNNTTVYYCIGPK